MKFFAVFAVLFGWTCAFSLSSAGLESDLRDLYRVIPFQEYKDLTDLFLKEDQEFANAINYLQGEEWKNLLSRFTSREETQKLIGYLEESGLPVRYMIDEFLKRIDAADTSKANKKTKGNLESYLHAARLIFPREKFLSVLRQKFAQNEEFRQFYVELFNTKLLSLLSEVSQLPEAKEINRILKDMGLNVA